MSRYLDAIDTFGREQPSARAFFNSSGQTITYGQLVQASNKLAQQLVSLQPSKHPIAVWGHKNPFMLVGFLASVKSGHPYVPLDTSLPTDRVRSILEQIELPIVIDTLGTFPQDATSLASTIVNIWQDDVQNSLCNTEPSISDNLPYVDDDDTFYILFTSGSTGAPKGVEVSASNVDAYWEWMCSAFCPQAPQVFFNRAPFTFDLSVTDLVRGLGGGDTLFALESDAETSLKNTFNALAQSGTTFWVSTPSFADMCLADPSFNQDLLPSVHTFFFVGETLLNETARQLLDRFPQAQVINGYGPTESTVLVTACSITKDMVASPEPLPVGIAKPNVILDVLNPNTLERVAPGQPGELFIVGDTVAKGYYKRKDATDKAFNSYPYAVDKGKRSYRTGDEVVLDKAGMLHFRGRYDFQVKLHGYRVELGDIESNLCALPHVRQAVVLPIEKDDVIVFLRAFVLLEDGIEHSFSTTRMLKELLGKRLPSYMIPRAFFYCDEMPLNTNGKIDRKALSALAEGK